MRCIVDTIPVQSASYHSTACPRSDTAADGPAVLPTPQPTICPRSFPPHSPRTCRRTSPRACSQSPPLPRRHAAVASPHRIAHGPAHTQPTELPPLSTMPQRTCRHHKRRPCRRKCPHRRRCLFPQRRPRPSPRRGQPRFRRAWAPSRHRGPRRFPHRGPHRCRRPFRHPRLRGCPLRGQHRFRRPCPRRSQRLCQRRCRPHDSHLEGWSQFWACEEPVSGLGAQIRPSSSPSVVCWDLECTDRSQSLSQRPWTVRGGHLGTSHGTAGFDFDHNSSLFHSIGASSGPRHRI